MAPERTELEWPYQPADLFEERFEAQFDGWTLTIEGGAATAAFPGGRPDDRREKRIAATVRAVFHIRAMQARKGFRLDEPARVSEFTGGLRNRTFRVNTGGVLITGGDVNLRRTGPSGALVADTRSERIERDAAEMIALGSKAASSPVLLAMLASRYAAMNDPDNELTHLYEVRDALAKHFGSAQEAQRALDVSASSWSSFGRIANEEPLLEGRHRGKHGENLRHATSEELETVRDLANKWLRKFAASL